MAADDKHILVSEKEEKEERESLFVGYARVMSPTYDPYITVEQFAAKTLSSAITKGKEVLFDDINSAFRGGVKKLFGIDFELDQLESYFDEEDFFIDLFEGSGANYCSPGGPAVLCIKEIEWEKGEKFSEKIVYQLPQKVDVELKSDDDEEEEEEEEEEEKEKEEKKKKKDGKEKNQVEEEEEGTSTKKRKREESSTDGGEKGKKREKEEDGGEEKSVYIGFVRTMAVVYDPYVIVKQFVAKTRESAIEKGKNLYFQEVIETSLDFEFEEIEKYPICQFAKIWQKAGPGDNPSMRCGPGFFFLLFLCFFIFFCLLSLSPFFLSSFLFLIFFLCSLSPLFFCFFREEPKKMNNCVLNI